MHRIRSSLKLLLAIFTTVLLIFVLNALLPPLTAKQQLVSQVFIAHLDSSKAQSSPVKQQKQLEVYKNKVTQETRHYNIISKVESNIETTDATPVSMKQQWKPLKANETDTATWKLISKRDVMAETGESSTVHVKQQRKPLNVKDAPKINENIVRSEEYISHDRVMQDSIAPSQQSVSVVSEKQQPSVSSPLALSESSSKAQYNQMERNRKRLEQLRAQHWEALRHLHGHTHQTLPQNISRPVPIFHTNSTHSIGKLKREEVEGVEAFVFFVGWQRSGHSIIGSLLDGHPDVVIAHELFLFSNLPQFIFMEDAKAQLFRVLYLSSLRASKAGARSQYHNEKGYNLHLENSWQGTFRKLRVIGDKTAGDVTNSFSHDPVMFRYLLKRLSEVVSVPLKVINVVRNPFDMVATLTLYRGSRVQNVKVRATETKKYDNSSLLEWSTSVILRKAKALHQIENNNYNWSFIRLYSEDFIKDPKTNMAALCTFLGIECTEKYLQQCADKTFSSVSKSRHLIVWSPHIVEEINSVIQTIPFLRRYSFDGT